MQKRIRNLIFILIFIIGLCVSTIAYSDPISTQIYASWLQVSPTTKTLLLPQNSRNIQIHNGSASVDIYVDLLGGDWGYNPTALSRASIIPIMAGESIYLEGYATDRISLKASKNTASPVSVLVTF